MKIWLTDPNVDKYMWILFSKRNNMKISQFENNLSKLNSEGKDICFDKKILFRFQDRNLLPTADIMYVSPIYWLANSKA